MADDIISLTTRLVVNINVIAAVNTIVISIVDVTAVQQGAAMAGGAAAPGRHCSTWRAIDKLRQLCECGTARTAALCCVHRGHSGGRVVQQQHFYLFILQGSRHVMTCYLSVRHTLTAVGS
jgi:hypothetical protein